jgi:hypothetical protein
MAMKASFRKSLFLILFIALFVLVLFNQPDASADATSGASGVKVVCDRWPDGSNMSQFSQDAIRLMKATTNEEKALAVWRFIRMWSAWTDGNNPREPALKDTYIDDPIKVLNVYGAHWCDGLARAMEIAWRALGFRAEKLYRSGHTQADVYWQDQDGIARWHLMDISQGWYTYDRTGTHIATPNEISQDYSLIFRPSKGNIPKNPNYWGMANWVHPPHLEWPRHSTELGLRLHEKSVRLWSNLSLPYQDNYAAKGKTDFEHGPYPVTYGNGVFQYSPDLASTTFKHGLWTSAPDIISSAEDGLSPHLHPAATAKAATAIFQIQSPYIITDASISGNFHKKTSSDGVALYISSDLGQTWKQVWQATQTEDTVLEDFNIAEKFDIYKAVPAGLISPFGRYQYLLKVELLAAANITDAGVNALTITTTTQHNIFSLPQLWPGENKITISGSVAQDTSLRIIYSWQDSMGTDESITTVDNLPYTFSINAAGSKWQDVVTKSISIEAIPRVGNGNGTELKGKRPTTTLSLTQAQAFPTERIVGTSQPAALKTAAQYILDLKDATKQIQALNGLIVLKDKSASDPIKNIAFESIKFPNKDLAIQALHIIGGADSIPVLTQILKKSPEVKWKYDAANKLVELEHWYHTSAMIGRIMADAHEASAAPFLAAVLDNVIANNDSSWEPHAGIIRSLGELGVQSVAASIRPFLDRNEDVSTIAIWALGELKDYASAEQIKNIFYKTSYSIRQMRAAEALGKLGYQGIFSDLCRLLSSTDENMRATAAEALRRLGNKDAIPFLQDAMGRERCPWARELARASIAFLSKGPDSPSQLRIMN